LSPVLCAIPPNENEERHQFTPLSPPGAEKNLGNEMYCRSTHYFPVLLATATTVLAVDSEASCRTLSQQREESTTVN
jgi:hypothetical protein